MCEGAFPQEDDEDQMDKDEDPDSFIFGVTMQELSSESESLIIAPVYQLKAQKPMVDSGAIVSCCPPTYAEHAKITEPNRRLRLKTVLNEDIQHTGTRPDVKYTNEKGLEMHAEFQVTDCTRPVLSVKERRDKMQATVFSPGLCKIVKDPKAIQQIEEILRRTPGFDIVEEQGAFVLDGELADDVQVQRAQPALVMPVVEEKPRERSRSPARDVQPEEEHRIRFSEAGFQRELNKGLRQVAQEEKVTADILQEERGKTPTGLVGKRAPMPPSQAERLLHAATHCPYRDWCPVCVKAKAPDPRHSTTSREEHQLPLIEVDYATASGKTTDPEHKIPIISASESLHGGTFCSMIRKKGAGDEYVIQAFLNWIESLGGAKFEFKCDQEPALVELRDVVTKRAKIETTDPLKPDTTVTLGTILVPYASPKGSKGALGHAERAHLSVGGQIRVLRLQFEQDYGVTLKPDHWTIPWLVRHGSWLLDKCQTKWSGKTPYQSRRGKAYQTPFTPLFEKVLFKVLSEDKFQERWSDGIYVGRIDQTDEVIVATPDGITRSRSLKRLEPDKQHDLDFLNKCKGAPWNPRGLAISEVPLTKRGDPLRAGGRLRRLFITEKVLAKFGRTSGCPRCEKYGAEHSAECRQRIEKKMVEAGDAFEAGAPASSSAPAVIIAPQPAEVEGSTRRPSVDENEMVDDDQPEVIVALIKDHFEREDVKLEFWKDYRAYAAQRFPYEKQEEGRQREVDHLNHFKAVEDIVPKADDKIWSCGWVEDWKGDDVRCRLVVRQFNQERRLDLFSATPDTWFMRFQMITCSCDEDFGALIVDISCAFMHAEALERVVVKVPPGLTTSTGYWLCKKALNGSRKASQAWTEHSAEKVIEWGGLRNDVNPAVFKLDNLDIEQHGDDFLCTGPRKDLLALTELFKNDFLVKKAELISPHPDDLKEGHFLHRRISVGESGWHLELDRHYLEDLVKQTGISDGRTISQPGYKESAGRQDNTALNPTEHTAYRSGGGLLQYVSEFRGDVTYATKEILRHGNAPTQEDAKKVTRVARYVKGVPHCVMDFKWRQALPETLDLFVDSDWSGELDTRKSTSGGAAVLDENELKHWCQSQPSVSLSSGEAEAKSCVRGTIEGLYIANLLREQGYEFKMVLHTDSSAALGHYNRLGPGKRMRHLEGMELWLQQIIRSGKVSIEWIHGLRNPADLYTKYLSRDNIVRHMTRLGFRMLDVNGDMLYGKDLGKTMPEAYSAPDDDEWEDTLCALLERYDM